jgi:hypothetical protein
MSRSIDRIIHDVENLKTKILPPKIDISESIKALHVSMDESKKRTAMLRAKREFLEKAITPGFYRSDDEDIKMMVVASIDSLFSNIKLAEKGTEDESTLVSRSSHNSKGENLDKKIDKSGFGEVKNFK